LGSKVLLFCVVRLIVKRFDALIIVVNTPASY